MFDNIGEKIKGYAKFIFVVSFILGIIGAIASWIAVGGFGGFMLFLLIGTLAFVLAYLSVMFVYAFGDLVGNAARIRKNTEELYNINYETYSNIYDMNKTKSAPLTDQKPQAASNSNPDTKPLKGWICQKCDYRNPEGIKYCRGCGEKRHYE